MSIKTQKSRGGVAERAAKFRNRELQPAGIAVAPQTIFPHWWIWLAVAAAALIAALLAYEPALRGQFVFDDAHMRFAMPHPEAVPFRGWIGGARPLVGFSYWIDYQLNGTNPFAYHFTNLLLHTIAALFAFLIVRRILQLAEVNARRATIVAAFCGAIFLLHPVQTEAVAYISGRSESLSVAFAFAAWAVFLYRPAPAIGAKTVLAILLLFAAAVTAKEHVAVLPLVIFLTDYYWNPGFSLEGVRRNWKLYGAFLAAGVVLAGFLYSYLAHEQTIGFNLKDLPWYQYLFTQFRMLFLYGRLVLMPFNQTADYIVEPSRTLLHHGAIFGLLGLLAAAIAAIVWRKRFRIASFGFFIALVLFLPTSSFVPIRDIANERRIYLPLVGLLLIAAEALVRIRWSETRLATALAAIVFIAGVMTWNRSQVWSSQVALWSDTVAKSPEKARPHLGLASAYYQAGRYADAVREYETAAKLGIAQDSLFYSSWAVALDGAGRLNEAIRIGRKAVDKGATASTYAIQARLQAEDGNVSEALALLDKAEQKDGNYEPIYIERGDILMALDRNQEACTAFARARALEPADASALKGLIAAGCGGSMAAKTPR